MIENYENLNNAHDMVDKKKEDNAPKVQKNEPKKN